MRGWLAAILVMMIGVGAWGAGPATRPGFEVYQAMMFKGQPPLERYGIKTAVVVGNGFWGRGEKGGFDESKPDEKACRATAWWAARSGGPVVIDIEHWPVDVRNAPEKEVRESLEKLGKVVDWMHSERPGMKVGFYGVIPLRDYWTPVGGEKEKMEQWRKANDLVMEYLGKRVDFVCPSIYTFYENREEWKRYAEGNLAEARRSGRPVYPFLWMDYHESTKELAGKTLPGEYWRMQLEVCRRGADGVVIWGGWKFPVGREMYRAVWDAKAEWWVETVKFMGELKGG